jgi:hypothetical protein
MSFGRPASSYMVSGDGRRGLLKPYRLMVALSADGSRAPYRYLAPLPLRWSASSLG